MLMVFVGESPYGVYMSYFPGSLSESKIAPLPMQLVHDRPSWIRRPFAEASCTRHVLRHEKSPGRSFCSFSYPGFDPLPYLNTPNPGTKQKL